MNILLVGTHATPGSDAVLRALLHAWGHAVRDAEDDGPADLVLLDLDGAAPLEHPTRPALGLVTLDYPGTAERCQAAGLHDLLAKPVHPAQLRAAIETATAVAPPFDYAQALAQADPWIVGVIAPQFMQDWPQQLAALEAAMHAADAPTAQRIAHTLKGLVANFHATPLVRTAQALEADSALCTTPAYQTQAAALRGELTLLDVALVAFCLAHPDAM
jgi:HPt (histidine-containing phosphotransfer) domain-containing protein/CheY-like chemotaxis protein